MKQPPKTDEKDWHDHHLRNDAEKRLNLSDNIVNNFSDKTPEEIIHELRVHQIELEIQNEELKKAHQDLEISRDKFIDLYDFAPLGYFTLTNDALIAEVNLTGATMFGLVRRDMIHARFRRFVKPTDYDHWDQFFRTIWKSGERLSCEIKILTQEGNEFLSVIEGVRVKTGQGSFQVHIAVSDVTKRNQTEYILRLNEERLLMAQKIGQNGCWEFTPETNTIWGSAEGLRIFGFPSVAGDIPINEIETCIQERERVHQALIDLITYGHEYDLEYVIHPADGSDPRFIHSVARIEKDGHGNLLRVRGIIQDITERKTVELELLRRNEELRAANEQISAAEEELKHQYYSFTTTDENLRQTKEYLENLISVANVPIIVWNPSFRITRLNHAFELLIGRSAAEVIGQSLEFLFPPDQADRSLRLFQTTLDGVRWETTEIDIMHRNGTLRTLLWNSATLYTPDGLTPVATIAQGHDVTDERRLELEKEAALGQIKQNLAQLAILNDEIRNPLTVIALSADKIDDIQVMDQIIGQTQRIDEMITQLDQRWMESEKILGYLQKHYQISFDPEVKQDNPEDGDLLQPVIRIGREFPSVLKDKILIEEVQAQLYTILDSIDALVYVADMETHELLFINRQGRSRFGDITGQKCYKSIQINQDGPCSICTNHLLIDQSGPTGVYRWEYQNTRNGRWYDCRDRAIRWSDGRLVRLEIATDITERKQADEIRRENEIQIQSKLRTLLSPEGVLELFNLADIIDIPKIQLLISDYHKLTEIAVAIFDLQGNTLVSEGWQDICTEFHRIHPETSSNCLESNTILAQGGIAGKSSLFLCKNNMWHYSTPIIVGGIHLGNLFIGQFFFDDEILDYSLFRDQAKHYGFEEESYIAALDRVPRVSREMVHGVMQFYTRFIHLITQVSWSNIKLAKAVHERDTLLTSVQESERKFRDYINNAPNGVFIADEGGRYLEINPAACEITGYSEDELLQMQIVDLLPPESYEFAGKHFQQVVEKGRASGEFLFRHKDGSLRYWSVDAVKISSTRFMGFVQDISRRKHVDESLRTSEEKYRLLIEHANNAIGIVQEGLLQLVNPRMIELTGFPEEVLLSKPFPTFIHPDDREMVVERYQQRVRGEDPPSRYTFRLTTKKGNITWVEINAVAVEWEGKPATLNFLIDITDRKQAEVALMEIGERFRILSENAPVGVLTSDLEGRITYLNPKVLELLGSESEEKTKEVNLLTFPPLVASGFSKILSQTMKTGESAPSIEFAYTSMWGKSVHYLGHISPLTRDGRVYGAQIILDDITERKKDEQALRESNQKLRLLTSLTRHDIFNQISTVELFQNLALQTLDVSKIYEYISHARQAGERIEKTIGFTKEYEDFGIASSGWHRIHHMIESAKSEVTLDRVTAENQVSEDIEVYADPIIRKVFTTLLENAIRHGEKITMIRFSCNELKEDLILIYEDDGIGIPIEEKDLIFDHGYGKNTGIGLFLSREILSITGLSIRECGIPSEGARFEILVPNGKYRYKSANLRGNNDEN